MSAGACDIDALIHARLDQMAGDLPALGVAVSGGGDSIALMHMVATWAAGRRIMVATVDHGLRSNSRAEAEAVARQAAAMGLPHRILTWQREEAFSGNLMADARNARLQLLSQWARDNDLAAIALGHTADDQAETLIMRLNRGAGVDGLGAMSARRHAREMLWLRPMLEITRQRLRDWLQARQLDWIDDPSNDNEDFERVRVRKSLKATGWSITAIADSAAHLREARDALTHYVLQACAEARFAQASMDLPLTALQDAPSEIQRRILLASARWITGQPYPPRRAGVANALAAVLAGRRVTLDGVLFHPRRDHLRIMREPAAAMRAPPAQELWDNRWRITGLAPGQTISALGPDNLADTDWRDRGFSHDQAIASPAVYEETRMIAAPALQHHDIYAATPLRTATDFRRLVLAH